jgi:hypothetical protein
LQVENDVLKMHSLWVYQSLAGKVNPCKRRTVGRLQLKG